MANRKIKNLIPYAIVSFAFILSAGIMYFGRVPEKSGEAQWNETTGSGISTPACTSSSASSDPSAACTNSGSPTVSVSWTYNGNEGACSYATLNFAQTSPSVWTSQNSATGKIYAYGMIGDYLYAAQPGNPSTTNISKIEPKTGEVLSSDPIQRLNSPAGAVVDDTLYLFDNAVAFEYKPNPPTRQGTLSPPPVDFQDAGAAAVNNKIYIFKGTNNYEFDPSDGQNGTWTRKASIPNDHGQNPIVGQENGIIYVIGGSINSALIDAYDPSNNSWRRQGRIPSFPANYGRTKGTAVTVNNTLVVVGGEAGVNASGNASSYPVTLSLSRTNVSSNETVSVSWANSGTTYPKDWIAVTPRGGHWSSSAFFYTDGLASGSKNMVMPTPLGDYDLVYYQNDGYTVLKRVPIAVTTSSGPDYLIWKYIPSTTIWVNKQDIISPRNHAAAVFIDNKIYVLGGVDSSGQPLPTGLIYDVLNDSSYKLRNLPCATNQQETYVWTGARAVSTYVYYLALFNASDERIDSNFGAGSTNNNPVSTPNCLRLSSCTGTPTSTTVGAPVTWAASAAGGTANYWENLSLPGGLGGTFPVTVGWGAVNGKLYQIVDEPANGVFAVWVYNPANNTWSVDNPFLGDTSVLPLGITKGNAGLNGKLYNVSASGKIYEYDTSTKSLTEKESYNGTFLSPKAVAIYNGKLYVFEDTNKKVAIYNPSEDKWTTGMADPFARSANPADITATAAGDKIYVTGGDANGTLNEVYDPNVGGRNWSSKANIPIKLKKASSTFYDNRIYIFGGYNGTTGAVDAAYIFDPVSNSWSTTSNISNLVSNPSATTIGTRVYIVGGDAENWAAQSYANPYTFTWTGTDNLNGTASNIQKTYAVEGVKTADIAITDSANTTIGPVSCNIDVNTRVLVYVGLNPPAAFAGAIGPMTTGLQSTVRGALASDPDNNLAQYSWTLKTCPGGSCAGMSLIGNLNGPLANGQNPVSVLGPTLTPTKTGSYTLELTVTDSGGLSAKATVVGFATAPKLPPNAPNMGPAHQLYYGVPHSHDGASASDPNNDLTTYTWSFAGCPGGLSKCPNMAGARGIINNAARVVKNSWIYNLAAAIFSGNFASPAGGSVPAATFTPNSLGNYALKLEVQNGNGLTASGQLTENAKLQGDHPACSDGEDNDGDGKIDHNDSPYRRPPYHDPAASPDNECGSQEGTSEGAGQPKYIETPPN